MPGLIFSASGKYCNCIRFKCAQPRNDTFDKTVITVDAWLR